MAVFSEPKKTLNVVTLNNTLTSGITKNDGSLPISEILAHYSDGFINKLYLRVNTLLVASVSSAALSWGENIFNYPAGMGLVMPVYTHVAMTTRTASDQTSTAGEVGLGTTIGSGTVATLGGTAAFENIMEGTTIANMVADTALVSSEGNSPVAYGDHGAAGLFGIQDASGATAVNVYLNFATTFDLAVTTNVQFGGTIVHWYRVLGDAFGVE